MARNTLALIVVVGLLAACTCVAASVVGDKIATPAGLAPMASGCDCVGVDCGCCVHISIADILDDDVCLNLTYIASPVGIELTLSIDGKVIYEHTFGVGDEKFCIRIPFIVVASICVDLFNFTVTNDSASVCVKMEVDVLKKDVYDYDFGCLGFDFAKED
eukprot:TRINITY_DN5659_c0_g1_i5.p2 TRINITY_DN5659_c0_g1~~TRINITY_DN5659_c0_g1_i5.p2  ORF type:complete len:160 (-),score=57.88 TRINITY_DN5659_c0_g1_i5:86-565(-)